MRRALVLWVLTVTLAACAVTPPHAPVGAAKESWRARQATLSAITTWSFDGRIGVTLGKQGWHADLRWQQRGKDYDIRISGPLGQGAGLLQGGPSGVVLTTPDRKQTRAADAESLMYAKFGWWVPVSGLRYWLRGLPDPATPAKTTLDARNQLTHLVQADWDIHFTRYARVGAVSLPDRLTLENDTMKVKLIIDSWHVK